LISIFLESVVVMISLMIGLKKKKTYGHGFASTFAIYVFYDTTRLFSIETSETFLYIMFFAATVSALFSVWELYRKL
jgi:uncharacterized membrane protein